MDPISSNTKRPFLPVSFTSLVNEATKETSSVEDPKYALSSYTIIHDSSIFLHFLTSILFLIIEFLLDLRHLALYSISDKVVNLACIRS